MHQFLSLILLISALLIGVHADCDPLVDVGGSCGSICCFDNICCGPGTVWFEGQCVPVHTISPFPNDIPCDWSDKCFQSECEAEECCAEDTQLNPDPNRSDDACWCVFNPGPTPTSSPSSSPAPTTLDEKCKCEKTGKFFVNGKSTGTAKKFRKPDGKFPTDKELKRQQKHVEDYDGKTSFKGEYHIALDMDSKLKKDKSWVQFDLICFTNGGEVDNQSFKTEKIPITAVVMDDECEVLELFNMASNNWYPKADAKVFKLDTQNLKGVVDLVRKWAVWTAEYGTKAKGILSSFKIEGVVSDKSDNCKPK